MGRNSREAQMPVSEKFVVAQKSGFTVGYHDHVLKGEIAQAVCFRCGGTIRKVSYGLKTRAGREIHEGSCMQCGLHVYDLSYATKLNPTGVDLKLHASARLSEKDPIVTPEFFNTAIELEKLQRKGQALEKLLEKSAKVKATPEKAIKANNTKILKTKEQHKQDFLKWLG
jgi:hypothetical protein